jgi:hypothetical protein
MSLALSIHNPESIRVADRLDERATLLLSRVEIQRSSHAGKLFAWLFGRVGGRAGEVAGVTLGAIVAEVECSESGARKWLKLLEARGLIAIAERAKRLDPYTIHVLESPVVAQRTFDFMPEPTLAPAVVRVVGRDVPETDCGNIGDESRAPAVRTNGTHQRYAPTVREIVSPVIEQKPTISIEPKPVDGKQFAEPVDAADEQLDAPLAQQLRRGRASSHQTNNQSISIQTQPIKPVEYLSRETARRPDRDRRGHDERLSTPATLGSSLAESLLARLASPEAVQRSIEQLKGQVIELLAGEPTLSRRLVDRVCQVAMTEADADRLPFAPSHVLAIARKAKGNRSPAAYFHGAAINELRKRGIDWKVGGGAR